MSWGEVKKINSDMETPLNTLSQLMAYKSIGGSSWVFQEKTTLQKCLMSSCGVNDKDLRDEAVISANSNDRVGELLAKQYGLNLPQLAQYATLDAIRNSSDLSILKEFYTDDGQLNWLFDSKILTDDFYKPETIRSFFDEKIDGLKDSAIEKFYVHFYNDLNETFESVKSVYDAGGKWWKKFDNQDWLKSVYEKLTSEDSGNTVRNSTAVGDSTSAAVTKDGNSLSGVRAALKATSNGKNTNPAYFTYGVRVVNEETSRVIDIPGLENTGIYEYNADITLTRYIFIPVTKFHTQIYYAYVGAKGVVCAI